MVDLTLLQSVSYVAAAIGVSAAAIYYVMTLRETNRNRRITTTSTLLQTLLSLETCHIVSELMIMKWENFDDFYKKYDSSVNPDNLAKRQRLWGLFDVIGSLYKSGLLDMETLYCSEGLTIINAWIKFKPIIEKYRKISYGKDHYENWEFVAGEIAKFKEKKDPLWRTNSPDLFNPEEYDRAFNIKTA